MYCPKCKSRLYPIDTDAIKKHGVCSYCVTYDPKKIKKGKYNRSRKEKQALQYAV